MEADIIRPSVNAEQFGFALKSETALNKGQLSLSIPLMELKGKGYDLPVSLTFYNGDVTCTTEASPIGLGWALLAGGVITKTIRGADDMDGIGSDNEQRYNENYILNNWQTNGNLIFNLQEDAMPDEYTYSLPGHSGTIDVSFDGNTTKMSLYPDESYKIESTQSGYCITADDGTKFYFEEFESRTVGVESSYTASTSYFLTRIETIKGGIFTFNYASEEYVDLSTEEGGGIHFQKFSTKRIASINSEFGSITFDADSRYDRGGRGNCSITQGLESKRIKRIELRDENGGFIKGYELDNSNYFETNLLNSDDWCNRRLKLSSVTQYDAVGNRLPPYEFTYSHKFSKSKMAEWLCLNDECQPRNSWTGTFGSQAYVDLTDTGDPFCTMMYPDTEGTYIKGLTTVPEGNGPTADDYFCLNTIHYPNGAADEFKYENHTYNMINKTDDRGWHYHRGLIQGKRLKSKIRHGERSYQRTNYYYRLHDADYNLKGVSSGILTNPSIFGATYYTPELYRGSWVFRASRITSEKAFNSFMGPPVCYTEVEEVVYNEFDDSLRTIHYFEPQIVSPPVNYIILYSHSNSLPAACLVKVENTIYGTKRYMDYMSGHSDMNFTYMAYPVGEFSNVAYIVDQPLKEVYIGKHGEVRSIKRYSYSRFDKPSRYGYKVVSREYSDYTTHLISMSEYPTRRCRLSTINTTCYYYDNENRCDSICDEDVMAYNKGRVYFTKNTRGSEEKRSYRYFPDDIMGTAGNSPSPEAEALNGLMEKNILATPIKAVTKRNDDIIGGECLDYQTLSGKPLLKTLYKVKNANNNSTYKPTINNNSIDYHVGMYKEGEVITYDAYDNPEHIKLNDSQDRYYVWGYGGRFPIAVIDNIDDATFANLKSQILQLETYKRIDTETECTSLRNTNADIRSNLPDSVHITTYTYDPYIGMTSEMDDSNLGTIYTYDTFGRLFAAYDVNYRKKEEYNYHYKRQ